MKQLQNNYTTPEQSKRLLKLGLPADSADMYYSKMSTETFWSLYTIGSGATYTSISTPPYDFMFVPCWSVGRLMEIYHICWVSKLSWSCDFMESDNMIDDLIQSIELFYSHNMLDFSKVEE